MRLFDQRFQWSNPSHHGLPSVCRVRVYQSAEGMGLVVIITEAAENRGPSLDHVLGALILAICATEKFKTIPGFRGFDSAMWYKGGMGPSGPRFFRVRGSSAWDFEVDESDSLPGPLMDRITGDPLSEMVDETGKFR